MPTEALETFLQNLSEQIIQGEMQITLDQLQNYLSGCAPKLKNEALLHMARFNRLRRDERKGLISRDTAQTEQSRLENDVLSFLEEIPKYVNINLSPASIITAKVEGVELPSETNLEKILGINNLKQISWIQLGIKVSRSVCRILTPDSMGTGFLIGPNRLMTNHHVIPSPEIASKSYAEFNYQQDGAGAHLQTYRFKLKEDLFKTSPLNKLDYTIIGIEADLELSSENSWGCLQLNAAADPVPSEHVIIVQHPNGGLKQIAMTANQIISLKDQYLYYTTDTMPGSSGSPVFNDLWQVIALHHAYGGLKKDGYGNSRHVNEGILMSAIKKDAGEYWPQHY